MLAFVILAVTMRPTVSALGLWVSLQIKNLNLAPPDGLTAKDFMDTHGLCQIAPQPCNCIIATSRRVM